MYVICCFLGWSDILSFLLFEHREPIPPLPLVCNEGEMVERFQRTKDSLVNKNP